MKSRKLSQTVRRSVALPQEVIEEARAVAPKELKDNLNRLVIVALKEFAAENRKKSFEKVVAQMATDPAIRKECASISKAFGPAEEDGLGD